MNNNLFVNIPTPASKFPTPTKNDTADFAEGDAAAIKRARNSSFAIVYKMLGRFKGAGITINDFWDYIKDDNDVDSRKDLDERQWVVIEARLRGASQQHNLFNELTRKVKQFRKEKQDGKQQEGTGKGKEASSETTISTPESPQF